MDKMHWIDVALYDIKSCRLLYENKLYAQSLFYFQQSIEKCSKYIGIVMGGFSERELRDISHNPIKIFNKMAKKLNEGNADYDSQFWDNELTKSRDIINKAQEDEAVVVMLQIMGRDMKSILPFDNNEVKGHLKMFMTEHMPNENWEEVCLLFDENSESEFKNYATKLFLRDCYGDRILAFLMMLSLLLSRFKVDDFRYPSEKYGNPIAYFNSDRILVKELKGMIELMESYILPMTKLIDWNV